ncbi:MAG TPA: hypothetical protein VES20_07365, partial [Bryobacteraceae bacterium]|nr:hypothetical protein [Bryobacteraceae bacterium]
NVNIGQNLSDFGAIWPDSQEGARKYIPRVQVSQSFNAHLGFLSLFDQNNFRFASTVSHVRGRHNIRFGGEIQRDSVAQFNDHDAAFFNFDGRASSVGRSQNVFGYAMADYVMGRVSNFSVNGILDYNLSNLAYFFFLQDEWRVTPRLVLTPGLRYEFYEPATEANDKASAFLFGHRSSQYRNAPEHLAFLGDEGIPSGFTKRDLNNLAPRLGIAYDVSGSGKTVVRGGFGVYYAYNPMQIRMWNAEGNPWRPAAQGGEALLRDPWGTSQTVVYQRPPTPFNPDPNNFTYPPRLVNVVGFNENFSTPYSFQWNVSVGQDIAGKVALEAAYVGNRGRNLLQMLPGNYPVYTEGATLGNIEARRPIPGYGHVSIIHSRARSWYDALQMTADTRLFKGLTSRFTYVWASAFDIVGNDPTGNGNIQATYPTAADLDKAPVGAKHTFRAFYVYDVPLLRGANSLLARIAGNWQVAGNVYVRSGNAINLTAGQDRNLDGAGDDRPNVSGPVQYAGGSSDERSARWIANPEVFTPAPLGTIGVLGRNALRGPGAWNTDLSVMKNFRFDETRYIQARLEAYNVLNHANLNDPVLNLNNSDFNRIINRSGNRTMQVGLRFLF